MNIDPHIIGSGMRIFQQCVTMYISDQDEKQDTLAIFNITKYMPAAKRTFQHSKT